MNELDLNQLPWLGMVAMFARIGAAVAIAPPFAHAAVPRRVRAMIAIALTIGLLPAAKPPALNGSGAAVGMIASEVVIGLAMGLAMSLVFSAASWAGVIATHQLGLNVAESYDPAAGGEGTGLGQAYWMLAVVVFLAANGHHAMLRGLRTSFNTIPVGAAVSGTALVAMLSGLMGAATSLALQIAAPVFVATLIADLALGLAGKTLAQLGVMSAALTVRSVVGLLALIAGAAITVGVFQSATTNWMQIVQTAIGNLGK
jgi:flagellar biosynthetic protein FliR